MQQDCMKKYSQGKEELTNTKKKNGEKGRKKNKKKMKKRRYLTIETSSTLPPPITEGKNFGKKPRPWAPAVHSGTWKKKEENPGPGLELETTREGRTKKILPTPCKNDLSLPTGKNPETMERKRIPHTPTILCVLSVFSTKKEGGKKIGEE